MSLPTPHIVAPPIVSLNSMFPWKWLLAAPPLGRQMVQIHKGGRPFLFRFFALISPSSRLEAERGSASNMWGGGGAFLFHRNKQVRPGRVRQATRQPVPVSATFILQK